MMPQRIAPMPFHANPHFEPPSNPESVIWRYMDFAKFVSLLDRSALHLARSDTLDDSFEGSVPHEILARRDGPGGTYLGQLFGRHEVERYEGSRRFIFINCWTMSEHESAAMWPLYVPSRGGVAVRSTYRRLTRALAGEPKPLFIGRVRYIDYATEPFVHDDANVLTPFVHKRKSFEHEGELRVLWWDSDSSNTSMEGHVPGEEMPLAFMSGVHPGGVSACVDLRELIEDVRVSPVAPLWFEHLVRAVLARYGLEELVVTRSDLAIDPVY